MERTIRLILIYLSLLATIGAWAKVTTVNLINAAGYYKNSNRDSQRLMQIISDKISKLYFVNMERQLCKIQQKAL
ncbi:hypothetical protein DSM106972_026390 [Dulcicalothrix desertica PCC 7102]|uniref:Uncharacterized protein n=1 Tax=Dulcicalothrix desertica PCC 7102 TaxID=232991 RepID=A0A3S1B9E1_9CYAN|nr:hypothetical protein DSM106972_026390 [Dulcicalothrix desertica PCC 7102]TWH55429.1 hypothetical protein CAL7102_03565 [Dulcicalothrix desertica PCC 7102]